MSKTLKKCLIMLIMMLAVLILGMGKVDAASASIGVSKSTVTEGENITVTVNFGEKVKSAQMIFSFNSTNLEYTGSNGTYNPATKKYAAFSMGGDVLSSATFTFKAKKAGSVSFSFSNLEVQNTQNGRFSPNVSNSSAFVTVKSKTSSGTNSGSNTKPSGNGNTTTKPNNNSNNKPTFTNVNQKVYAKETVSIRDSWSTSGKLLGTLQKDSSITRTGIGSNGWDRVTYNGRTAYISHTYLTTTKPKDDKDKDEDKDKDKNNTTNEENNQANQIDNNTTNNETTNNETNDITNNETNEATNTQVQGNKDDKKGFNINTIEMIIIGVIILAIIVIIVNEIIAKKRREAKRKEEKRVKGSRR